MHWCAPTNWCRNFRSWYLEWSSQNIDEQLIICTIQLFEDILRILHPFIPFISERKSWHLIKERQVWRILNSGFMARLTPKYCWSCTEYLRSSLQVRNLHPREYLRKESLDLTISTRMDTLHPVWICSDQTGESIFI
jgi:valyl-tRNA synthetase